ncbi:MAG TPA: hypothetical protein VF230_11585 [Acidimicrobiales bacterium]
MRYALAPIRARAARLLRRHRALEGALVAGQLAGVLASVVIARAVGAEGRGVVTALVIWSQLLGWAGAVALDKAIVVLAQQGDDPAGLLRASRAVTAVMAVPVTLTGVVLGTHLFPSERMLSVLLAVTSLVTSQVELAGGWLLATQRRARFVAFRLAQPAAYAGGTALAFLATNGEAGTRSVRAFAVAAAASLWAPLLLGPRSNPRRSSGPLIRRVLGFGLAAQAASVMQFLNSRLDLLMLSLMAPSRDVGVYAVGVAFGQVAVFVGSAGAIRGLTGEAKGIDVRGAGVVAGAGVLLAASAPWAIPRVFGESFGASVPVAQVLALGSPVNYLLQLMSGRLLGRRQPLRLALVQGAGAGVFLLGILISRVPTSVAVASVASYTVALLAAFRAVRRSPPRE